VRMGWSLSPGRVGRKAREIMHQSLEKIGKKSEIITRAPIVYA